MSVTAIIIDDEDDAREIVCEYLKRLCPYVEVIGQASSYMEAKELLLIKKADLLYLDINLDQKDSIQLLTELGLTNSQIIFITAYKTFALDAFAFEAVDYILKPIEPTRFKDSTDRASKIVKARKLLETNQRGYIIHDPSPKYGKNFAISTLSSSTIIEPHKLMRIHGEGAYVQMVLATPEAIYSSKGLKKFEFLLANEAFVKVHQSHIVNLDYCKGYVSGDNSYLITIDGHKVPVSRRKKDEIKAYFNSLEI